MGGREERMKSKSRIVTKSCIEQSIGSHQEEVKGEDIASVIHAIFHR